MLHLALFAGRSASAARPASPSTVSRYVAAALDRLATWQARARARRQLMALGEYELKDIGIGRGDAYTEYSKPFWRP